MLYPVCLKWNSLVDDVIAHKYLSVADSGEGLGEPTPSPSPSRIFTQTEARRAEKRFFGDRPPPRFIRVWMTPPPPPLHLKVWIRHCLSHKGNEGRLCHGWLVHFVYKHANYATKFAMKFEKQFLNDKITASCKTYMSPKDYLKRCKQQKLIFWKTSAEANKFSNTTIASTSINCMFVHLCDLCLLLHLLCYLYLVSFNIVGGYFYVLLNLVAVTSVWVLTAFVGHSFSFKDSVRCYF